jgi:hypothetical protein
VDLSSPGEIFISKMATHHIQASSTKLFTFPVPSLFFENMPEMYIIKSQLVLEGLGQRKKCKIQSLDTNSMPVTPIVFVP